jgi:hypothetical protein
VSPELRRLHEGLIRAVMMAVRAWQDWLRAQHGAQHGLGEQDPPKPLQ